MIPKKDGDPDNFVIAREHLSAPVSIGAKNEALRYGANELGGAECEILDRSSPEGYIRTLEGDVIIARYHGAKGVSLIIISWTKSLAVVESVAESIATMVESLRGQSVDRPRKAGIG